MMAGMVVVVVVVVVVVEERGARCAGWRTGDTRGKGHNDRRERFKTPI